MLTELLYYSDEILSEIVEKISFSDNSCLSLTKCEQDGLFRHIKRSAKDNDIVFLK